MVRSNGLRSLMPRDMRYRPRLIKPRLGITMPEMGKLNSTAKTRPSRPGATPTKRETRTSLADVLFTSTQQRVLALLFGQPSRSFFASELIQLAGSGSGAVQRELKRLGDSGLVTVTRIGKQKHYQANPTSPVFEELRSLVIKTVAMVDPLRHALEPLAKQISLALVYGSVAKGSDTAASDIDLLVVADDVTLERIYSALAPVEPTLGRKINPTLYTPQEFADRKSSGNAFLTQVLAGDHLVLIGNVDEPPPTR